MDVRGISQVEDSGFGPAIGMRSQSGIPEHHLEYQRGNNAIYEDAIRPALAEQNEEEEEDEEEEAAEEDEEDEEYYEEDPQQQNIIPIPDIVQ